MINLCYLSKCGKCDRMFNTQEQLKDHQTSCRGKKTAAKLDPPPCFTSEQLSGTTPRSASRL